MKIELLRFYRIFPQVFSDLKQHNLDSFFDLVELFKVGSVDKSKAEEMKHYTRYWSGATICHISLSVFYRPLLSVSFNYKGYIALNSDCRLYMQNNSPPKAMYAAIYYSWDENLVNMPRRKKIDFAIPLQ